MRRWSADGPYVRRTVPILRVAVALALDAAADLHHQLTVLRELQQLVIRNRLEAGRLHPGAIVSAQPHEALVVDVDAVLSFDPFITAARPTPGLDEIASRIEHDDRRRSHRGLIGLERPRTVQDPSISRRVDGDTRHVSELPVCRHLRPRGIYFKHRQVAALRLGSLSRRLGSEKPCAFHASDDYQCNQNATTKILALHVSS